MCLASIESQCYSCMLLPSPRVLGRECYEQASHLVSQYIYLLYAFGMIEKDYSLSIMLNIFPIYTQPIRYGRDYSSSVFWIVTNYRTKTIVS